MSTATERIYTSPDYKLIACFRQSRDGWKQKAQQAKRQVKKLKERLKVVRARRDHWKEVARQAAQVEVAESAKNAAAAGGGRARPR